MHSENSSREEEARLAALMLYGIVPDGSQAEFQTILDLAARLFDVPTVLVSLVERDRQIFAARLGMAVCGTSRSVSFCAHELDQDDVLVVLDPSADPRFSDNPLVTAPSGIRFYAGAPLRTPDGLTLGRLCLIDHRPRAAFSQADRKNLSALAALVFDKLEIRRLDRARTASQQRFDHVAETSPDGIICADHDGSITFWNGAAERLFGYSAEEARGRTIDFILPERLRAATGGSRRRETAAVQGRATQGRASKDARCKGLVRNATAGPARPMEAIARRKDSVELLVESSLSVWQEGERTSFGLIVRDISERRANEDRLYRLAHLDPLTKLPNRMALRARMEEIVRLAAPASAMILDLDGFKEVNDTMGHSTGDLLLQDVAARLVGCVGEAGVVARLGGDEFAILLRAGDLPDAARVADAIIAAVAAPFDIAANRINPGRDAACRVALSASIGIALFPLHGDTAEDLLSSADLALYQAKSEGKGCRRFFANDLRCAAVRRSVQSLELARAVANGEFELFYQPQVHGTDGRLLGAEALLRWRHPERGLQAPAAFLPALEGGALAAAVGRWVVRTACRQAAAWRQASAAFRMGVNLFGVQLKDGHLAATVHEALAETGLPPSALELEITENVILQHDEGVIQPLRDLHAEGVGIAFDDYGTGYASLSLLKRYPLTRLKIDQTFVHNMCGSPEDAAIVRAVIYLGRSFGLSVVAEGVETQAQRAFLVAEGCVDHQGYLWGAPMPAAEFERAFDLAAPRLRREA